jgi:hypothetical protein
MQASAVKRLRRADAPVVAALAALALYLAWRSRGWPLVHDAPLMHYIAWLIGEGAVPYRDVFDMNTPGVYLVHLAVIKLLGGGDLAWRAADLGWLALTSGALAAYAWPFGTGPALVSGLLFAVYHLAGGPWLAGQRDFFVCVFLVAGAVLVASGGSRARLALGGVLLGAAVTIKPVAALFVAVAAAAAALEAARGGRAWWSAALAVVGGGAIAPLACAGWLVRIGGMPDFLITQREYVLPLYSRLARVSPWTALGWWPYGRLLWALFAVPVSILAVTARRDRRTMLALAGVAYGVVHFVVQGKGWEYHLYPLGAFACLTGGLALAAPARPARRFAAAAAALLTVTLGAKGMHEQYPAWIAAKEARAEQLTAELRRRVAPPETVQVLDTGDVGVHALYALRLRQPTRFIYDFHFLHDEDAPFIQRLRREFMASLAADPPALIVVLEQGWPRAGYERLRGFPELLAWLDRVYGLDHEGPGFRIYAKRARP